MQFNGIKFPYFTSVKSQTVHFYRIRSSFLLSFKVHQSFLGYPVYPVNVKTRNWREHNNYLQLTKFPVIQLTIAILFFGGTKHILRKTIFCGDGFALMKLDCIYLFHLYPCNKYCTWTLVDRFFSSANYNGTSCTKQPISGIDWTYNGTYYQFNHSILPAFFNINLRNLLISRKIIDF